MAPRDRDRKHLYGHRSSAVVPSRRQFLAACATGLAGALAGCVETDAAMFVDPVQTDAAVAERATDAANQPEPRRRDHGTLVADAADGGAVVGGERAPFQPDRPVAHDDAVYDVRWREAGSEARTAYRIETTAREDSMGDPTITWDELPASDQHTLFELRDQLVREESVEPPVERLFQRYYDQYALESSVLVPEPEHDVVAVGDYEVEIVVSEVPVDVDLFEYEAVPVADSLAAFGAELRDAYQFALDDLSEDERSILEQAIDEGSYYYGTSSDQAFEGLAERLVAETAIYVDGREGEWLARYDGEPYWIRVDFVRMSEFANDLEAGHDVGEADDEGFDWSADAGAPGETNDSSPGETNGTDADDSATNDTAADGGTDSDTGSANETA